MKVKDIKTNPFWKEHYEKMASGEYDDYDIVIQIDGNPAPMSMLHADDKQKTIWWAGNSKLNKQ